MNSLKKAILAAFVFGMLAAPVAVPVAKAQGPVQKRINYTINIPYTLRMGDYTLAPGDYVLYQISFFDPNTFALFAHDMRHSPLAMIHTTRIYYGAAKYPSKTRMLLDIDESGNAAQPVIRGWNIPGEDGWEIISVVASKHNRYLTQVK